MSVIANKLVSRVTRSNVSSRLVHSIDDGPDSKTTSDSKGYPIGKIYEDVQKEEGKIDTVAVQTTVVLGKIDIKIEVQKTDKNVCNFPELNESISASLEVGKGTRFGFNIIFNFVRNLKTNCGCSGEESDKKKGETQL